MYQPARRSPLKFLNPPKSTPKQDPEVVASPAPYNPPPPPSEAPVIKPEPEIITTEISRQTEPTRGKLLAPLPVASSPPIPTDKPSTDSIAYFQQLLFGRSELTWDEMQSLGPTPMAAYKVSSRDLVELQNLRDELVAMKDPQSLTVNYLYEMAQTAFRWRMFGGYQPSEPMEGGSTSLSEVATAAWVSWLSASSWKELLWPDDEFGSPVAFLIILAVVLLVMKLA